MSSFFGALFKFIGGVIMFLTALWSVVVVLTAIEQHIPGESVFIDFVAFFLLVGLPWLIGRAFYKWGKRLEENLPEGFTQDAGGSGQHRAADGEPEWNDAVAIVPQPGWQVSPQQPPPQPQQPHFTPTRKPVQEVEVDVEPEPTPPPVLANPVPKTEPPPKPRAGRPDPTAMGVNELHDPDEE